MLCPSQDIAELFSDTAPHKLGLAKEKFSLGFEQGNDWQGPRWRGSGGKDRPAMDRVIQYHFGGAGG